jgi:serine/threonine-protein kinase
MWIEPDGDVVPMSATTGQFNDFYLSPDETQAATTRVSDGNVDIWIMHLERDTLTRLTFNESLDINPQFSADGRLVYFSSEREGHFQLYRKPADGSSEAERVFESEQPQFVSDLSPDGKYLLYTEANLGLDDDVWSLDLESGDAQPFVKTSFRENAAAFSPDGRWVSYDSNESGEWEVYVRPFPGPGGKWQISNGGGDYSRWSVDGGSIAYRGEGGAVMQVGVEATGSSLTIGTPNELFRPATEATYRSDWDLASDGRLLMITNPNSLGDAEGVNQNLVRFAFNWFEELERLLVGQ